MQRLELGIHDFVLGLLISSSITFEQATLILIFLHGMELILPIFIRHWIILLFISLLLPYIHYVGYTVVNLVS